MVCPSLLIVCMALPLWTGTRYVLDVSSSRSSSFVQTHTVHNFRLARDDLRPHDIAIIQFETRPLDALYSSRLHDYDNNYWNVSARWNKFYAMKHGHQYAYITMDPLKPCKSSKYQLSAVWCKVKAMIRAFDLLPKAKAFVYLDSDAVMTSNYSLSDIVGFMRRELMWDFNARPIALNQDGPGWACKNTIEKLKAYSYCLNSGTLFWIRDDRSLKMLKDWWRSADDDYETSKFTSKWRRDWPWEQAQLYLMKEKYDDNVMILSFPSGMRFIGFIHYFRLQRLLQHIVHYTSSMKSLI